MGVFYAPVFARFAWLMAEGDCLQWFGFSFEWMRKGCGRSACFGCCCQLRHFGMGVAGEAALLAAGVGVAEASEPVGWAGDGEQVIPEFAIGVLFDQEALFAGFYVEVGGAVGVAEAPGFAGAVFVDDVEDAAEVEGPEAEGVGFYGDYLVWGDFGFGVGDADPAELEVLPLLHGCFGG